MTEWPLLTGGVAPDMKAEGTAADAAVAATFTTETLKPKRLDWLGKYEHTRTNRRRKSPTSSKRCGAISAMRSSRKCPILILNGDESTNAQEPDGFLTKIAAPTAPSAESGLRRLCGQRTPRPSMAFTLQHGDGSFQRDRRGVQLHARGIRLSSRDRASQAPKRLKRRGMSCMASSVRASRVGVERPKRKHLSTRPARTAAARACAAIPWPRYGRAWKL